MKHSERFALDHWLSDYPMGLDYDEVLDLIAEESDRVLTWIVAEDCPTAELIEIIESTRAQVERMLDNLLYGICLSSKTEEESIIEGAMT